MHAFKGRNGKTYEITINGHTIDRVYGLVKFDDGQPVDLYQIRDDQFTGGDPEATLNRILSRGRLFVQVLHALLNVPFEDFNEAMDGDGLEAATEAFVQEIIDFFPRHRRPTLRALWDQQQELAEVVESRIRTTQTEVTKQTREIWESSEVTAETISNALASQFGVSPVNLASTLDPSLSANSSTWPTPDPSSSGVTPPQSLR